LQAGFESLVFFQNQGTKHGLSRWVA
jgi:hypothetical protein